MNINKEITIEFNTNERYAAKRLSECVDELLVIDEIAQQDSVIVFKDGLEDLYPKTIDRYFSNNDLCIIQRFLDFIDADSTTKVIYFEEVKEPIDNEDFDD